MHLLLLDKHCIAQIWVFHEKRIYSLGRRWNQNCLMASDKCFTYSQYGDAGTIGRNLRNRSIVLLIFWVIFFMCSTKFSFASNVNPRCVWNALFSKRMLLNERLKWSSFIVSLLNITSCACLVKSGLKIIFNWKA